jgi:hypothetical protein
MPPPRGVEVGEGGMHFAIHRGSDVDDFKQATRKWLTDVAADFNDPIFFTALFKDRVLGQSADIIRLTPEIARVEIKRFTNRIDRTLFGRSLQRFNRRVRRIPVLECGSDRGWHCHMLIERPERILEVRFLHILRSAWSVSAWAGGFHARQGDSGAVEYLTKERSKGELETWADAIVTEAMVLDAK